MILLEKDSVQGYFGFLSDFVGKKYMYVVWPSTTNAQAYDFYTCLATFAFFMKHTCLAKFALVCTHRPRGSIRIAFFCGSSRTLCRHVLCHPWLHCAGVLPHMSPISSTRAIVRRRSPSQYGTISRKGAASCHPGCCIGG